MKTLALVNGDLVAGQNGHVTISGTAKIRQDLSLLLGERWGTDRFHSNQWGSVLVDFIGLPITEEREFEVRSETTRAIQQYIAIQEAEIYADFVAGRRSRFATEDVVRDVTSISVRASYSRIQISITLVNQANQTVTLNRSVAQ